MGALSPGSECELPVTPQPGCQSRAQTPGCLMLGTVPSERWVSVGELVVQAAFPHFQGSRGRCNGPSSLAVSPGSVLFPHVTPPAPGCRGTTQALDGTLPSTR